MPIPRRERAGMSILVAQSALQRVRRAFVHDHVRRARIACLYLWRHGRWPNFDRPQLFTEWVQWRKLHGRHGNLAVLTDKLRSKALVASLCDSNLCVPTLWAGTALPEEPPGAFPLMVKANHGCRQLRVVRSPREWRRARRSARRWISSVYGGWLDEYQYRAARRLVLVEPLLGDGQRLPDDYKVYVFGGRAAIVQHHAGRGTGGHRWTQFDRDWVRVGGAPSAASRPLTLTAMIETAERLSRETDFLRVDFYEIDGRLWFGEFCLFPGSGLDPFEPVALDRRLGRLWNEARRK